MKKLVFFSVLAYILAGCGGATQKMNSTLDNVYPGMSLSEFRNAVKGESLVQMEQNYACYKVVKSRARFGEPGGYTHATRFFYFKDNKLYRIDEGTRATDLKIEIAKDITVH